ncbi:MAG: YHS domain-containing protein [Geobacter sp.]|nr:YHS domain-containing protein [Geobacter sp.]
MRFLLWLLLGYIGFRIIKSLLAGAHKPEKTVLAGSETFQDPVCGIYVTPEDATVGRLEGQRIYFCSRECLDKYQEKLNSGSI